MRRAATACALAWVTLGLAGCGTEEWDRSSLDAREGSGAVDLVEEPVPFVERTSPSQYGVPVADTMGVADLLALMPQGGIDREDPNLFVAAGDVPSTDQCQSGAAAVLADLPVTIEGVVSLRSAKYLKLPLCGQDERFYGSFVVEDDTGGVLVLGDSRVATVEFGDRVRLTVRGLAQFYGDQNQRAVVISDIERISTGDEVAWTPVESAFGEGDVGRTRRIEGFVVMEPTSSNFNAMVVSNTVPPPVVSTDGATPVCRENCSGSCRRRCVSDDNMVCDDIFCPAICAGGATFDASLLPDVCWAVSVEQELGRRGTSVPLGSRVSVTAPVVAGFGGLQMWIVRLGQLEFLADP